MDGAVGRGLKQLFGPSTERLVPLGIAYGEVVFASNLTGADGDMPDALRAMQAVVEEAGGSLENIARVTAYVPPVAEREDVYGPWDALFPDASDRPAFKVLVADLPEGTHVRLDMLARIGGRRRRIDLSGVSARDPTLRVGDWTMTSRVHGTHPTMGAVMTGGIDAEARQAVTNVRELVRLGGGPSEVAQLLGFVRDPGVADALRRAVGAPLTVLTNFVPPGMNVMLEGIAGTPTVREVYATDGPIPDGVMIDDLLFAPSVRPTGVSGDFSAQLESALQALERILRNAGLDLSNVAQMTVYFPDLALRLAMNDVWVRWFPDPADRPPHKYVPVQLPPGQLVQLQVFAMRGGQRHVLEIPGIGHGDPMSMGVRMGNLLFSSRVFGADPATGRTPSDPEAQASVVCANVRSLLAQAGATPASLTQVLAFVRTERDTAAARAALSTLADGGAAPAVHFLTTNLGVASMVRLEILGSIPEGAA